MRSWRIALLLSLALSSAAPARVAPAWVADSRPRLLVIVLDAVPFEVAVAVAAEEDEAGGPRFAGFTKPVPLVSTFPSTTSLALTGILGVDLPRGYEARFFDLDENRLRGAGAISYYRFFPAWRDAFDWDSRGLLGRMVGKARPLASSIAGVHEVVEAFEVSRAPVFLAYVSETDAAAHLKSPASVAAVLRELDEALAGARRRAGEPFVTAVLSDHGIAGAGAPLRNVRAAVRRSLRSAGFHLGRRRGAPQDVVMPELGAISSFVLYGAPQKAQELARAASRAEGVDLCVSRAAGGYHVESARGVAWIGRRMTASGEEWAYRALEGDPLRYLETVANLARKGRAAAGFHPDRSWFEATLDHPYPDALHRISRGFELVANPASVICATAPGYLYSAPRTALAARLSVGKVRWTHGALGKEETLGFFMTDLEAWRAPRAVRYREALAPFEPWLDERLTVESSTPPMPAVEADEE